MKTLSKDAYRILKRSIMDVAIVDMYTETKWREHKSEQSSSQVKEF